MSMTQKTQRIKKHIDNNCPIHTVAPSADGLKHILQIIGYHTIDAMQLI